MRVGKAAVIGREMLNGLGGRVAGIEAVQRGHVHLDELLRLYDVLYDIVRRVCCHSSSLV